MFLKIIFSCLFGFLSFQIFAQDSLFIKTYSDYFLVKSYINSRSLQFSISPPSDTNQVQYAPNVNAVAGFGVYFKGLGLSFNFKLTQPSQVRKQKGQSQYTDFRLNSFGKKIGFDAYYQDYKGYYIENPNEIFPNWRGLAFPKRGDLEIQNIATNVFYIFNRDKFSYRSSFVHDEQQLRSSGTFLLTASLGYLRIKADSSLIPRNPRFRRGKDKSFFRNANAYSFAITPGYAYNFVFLKKMYFSLSLSALVGMQYYYLTLPNERKVDDFASFFKGIGRMSLGYNSEKWVLGFNLQLDAQTLNTPNIKMNTTLTDFSFFIGRRFPTKILKGRRRIIQLDRIFSFKKNKKTVFLFFFN